MELSGCYMRWCGNVGSAFHVKVKAVFIALVAGYRRHGFSLIAIYLVSDNRTREKKSLNLGIMQFDIMNLS